MSEYVVKTYPSNEVGLAFIRWTNMQDTIDHEIGYKSFLEYLGADTFVTVTYDGRIWPLPPFQIGVPKAQQKMDALLSPYWYALTRAYLVAEGKE